MIYRKEICVYTLKIADLKVGIRNEIFHFFTFCSVLKIRKLFFEIIILLTNVFGGLSSCQNNFQTVYKEIVDNKFMLVHTLDKAKIGSKRTSKTLKIRKFEIQTSISPAGQANWPGSRSGLPHSIF